METEIKVGDVIFEKSRLTEMRKVKVVNITPKGSFKLDNGKLLTSDLRLKTSDTLNTDSYYIWSEELEEAYKLQYAHGILKTLVEKLDISSLDYQSTVKVINVLREIKK